MIVEEEEKHQGKKKHEQEGEIDPEDIMMKKAASQPWNEAKAADDLIESTEKMFAKRHKFILSVLKRLGLENVESLLTVPRIEGSKATLLAILLQNMQHPKNQHRREAIKGKQYVEIKTEGIAVMYLEKLVYKNLEVEFKN